jgi:hypothetical protein
MLNRLLRTAAANIGDRGTAPKNAFCMVRWPGVVPQHENQAVHCALVVVVTFQRGCPVDSCVDT